MSSPNDNVARWLPKICTVRESLCLSPLSYRADTLLALIDVESAGDPHAHRDGSQFWGLLQIADAYAQDACDYLGIDPIPAAELDGDGEQSIRLTLGYMESYSDLHRYAPSRIAALHKGGAGTAAQVREELRDGSSLNRALEHVEEQYTDNNGRPYAPNLTEYVERFRQARKRWARWLDEEGA
ncbi:MAG: hypothetical protein ACOCV2_02290 [Persicimonas sp.]